ncbi:MAG TPA: M23 family metallopeptidase [Gaiellaceae bacterium]|nr:M23 family metallopeptidase [Gaiellaceae bacterium]
MRALLLVASLGVIATAAGGTPRPAGASASSWAVRVVVAGAAGAGTATVTSPPGSGPASSTGFAFPAGDGSVISTGATTASSTTHVAKDANGEAASSAAHVSIFGGEITADAVSAKVSARTTGSAANGGFEGSGITNLRIHGQPVRAGRVALASWGYLTVDSRGVDTSAPHGAAGYRGFVTELDLHLNMNHGGLPAGSEIQVGYAEAGAQTAPNTLKPAALPLAPGNPLPGARPQLLPKQPEPLPGVPQTITPPLTAGPYDFPVYGSSSYVDTFGAYRPDVSFHHGDDIFGELGQPLLAVANGTLFSVGWNRVGGNRIWLRDAQGNEFYYAHLSAFSSLAVNGRRVKAGEVIGFMGDTGDAEGTPTHLHFEVHPVSLLYLGYDGAVDPTSYLESWKRPVTVPDPVVAGWTPTIPGTIAAHEPGAILLQRSDISSADGLDPESLRRAAG